MNVFSSSELTIYGVAAVTLLLLNAIFVATEFSLVKLRYTRFGTNRMRELQQSKSVAEILENIGPSMKVLRFGISICTVGSGFLLVPIARVLAEEIEWTNGWELRFSILASFLVAVGTHSVLGELVPRSFALQYPVQTIKISVPIFRVFRVIMKPFSAPLNMVSGMVLRVLKLDPSKDMDLLDVEAQIRSLVSEGEELPALAESIVTNAIELRKRVAHDVMIPRNQLQYIDLEDEISENLALVRKMGHTRYPICEGDLDHCVGLIHIKDVFRSGKENEKVEWRRLMRPLIRFSMDEPLESVLQRFLKTKQHFALLVDEFEGTVGAVTMEDVLEELVGDIQDEFDKEEELVVEGEEGTYEVDGLTALHDLAMKLGVELHADEVSTVGGYITYELGRMPKLNEAFRIGNLEIVATSVDERRVLSASVRIASEEIVEEPVDEGEKKEEV